MIKYDSVSSRRADVELALHAAEVEESKSNKVIESLFGETNEFVIPVANDIQTCLECCGTWLRLFEKHGHTLCLTFFGIVVLMFSFMLLYKWSQY